VTGSAKPKVPAAAGSLRLDPRLQVALQTGEVAVVVVVAEREVVGHASRVGRLTVKHKRPFLQHCEDLL
jgi:hypothetical protein